MRGWMYWCRGGSPMFGTMPAWRGHSVWQLKTPCRPIVFLLSSVTGQNACTRVFCILRRHRTVCPLTSTTELIQPYVTLYSSRVQSEAMLYIQTPPNRSCLSPLSAQSERHQTDIIRSLQHMWIKSAVLCKLMDDVRRRSLMCSSLSARQLTSSLVIQSIYQYFHPSTTQFPAPDVLFGKRMGFL